MPRYSLWAVLLWSILSTLMAQQPAAPPASNAPPSLQLTVQREFIPNAGPVARGQLLTQSNRLAFLLPPDTLARSDSALQRASFVARDDSYSIVVQLREGDRTMTNGVNEAVWRDQLAARHPDLRELVAFPCHALGTNGLGLDFVWRTAGGQRLYSRAVLLPLPGGRLEVSMLSDEAQFENAKHRFNSFLLTLHRSAPGEKAVVPVVVPD